MSLPKVNTPEYRLTIPSTDEELRYRPFLVKEEKILLIAQETGDEKAIYGAIKQLIQNCCFEQIDVEKLPLFDIEYIFLQIRAKSIGEIASIEVTCPDDKKTKVKVDVDLTTVNVHMEEDHDARIQLTDTIGVLMSYPHMGTVTMLNAQIGEKGSQIDNLFEMICDCMYQVWEGEDIHDAMDYSSKEKMEFVNSLNHDQFEKIQKFFESMPTVKHEVEITNPKTKKKSTITLQGMQAFF